MLLGIRWGSLRSKIIAWSFVPTALIMALVAGVTFTAYQRVTEDLVIVRNQELARVSAGELAARLGDYSSLLTEYAGILGGLPPITPGDESGPAARQDVLTRARGRFEVFDGGVLILSNQGTVMAAEPQRPEALGQDWSNRTYFRHMLRSAEPVFSDVIPDGPLGAEVIVVSVPIKGDQGQFLGLMAGMYRVVGGEANALSRELMGLRVGVSGDTYLVDGQGRVVYHTDPQRIGDSLLGQGMVQQVLAGDVGAQRTRDVQDRDIVASFAPVPGTNWGLVGEETWAELTRASRGYRGFLSALLVLGVLLPALVTAFGVRRITQPISELIGAAQEVATGGFSQTIIAETGDEIEVLAEQFNLMAAQLKESYANLEQRVEDRTRELAGLNALAATVSQSLHLADIMDKALEETLRLMGTEAGGIYLLDKETGLLTIAAQRGFSPKFISDVDNLRLGEGFSGLVAQSGEPLVVRDVSEDPRLTRLVAKTEGLRSLVSVPLRSKGEILGTLFSLTRGVREFSDEEVQLLVSIGNQIGVAVENARLYQDTKTRLTQLTALQETTEAVASTLKLDRLLKLIVERATALLHAEGGILNLVDWENNVDEAVAACGITESATGSRFPLEGGLSGWVALHHQPVIVNNLHEDVRVNRDGLRRMEVDSGRRIRNAAATPLTVKDQVVGSLVLLDKRKGEKQFTESDLDLLVALASQAATAIENARLFEAESKRRKEATLLAEMAKLTSGTLDLDEVLRLTAEYAIDVFDAQCCCVFMLDESQGTLRPAVQVGLHDEPAASQGGKVVKPFSEMAFVPSDKMRETVFELLQPFIVEDVPSEPHLSPAEGLEFQSVLVVPIEVGGRRLGAMQVATHRPLLRRFTLEEGELARAMANQAALAIENARLFDVEQRRAEQFRVISEVGRRTTSILAGEDLLDEMVRLIQAAFGYDVVEIGLVEEDELVFRAGVEKGADVPFVPFRLKLQEEGITGWVASTGQPFCVPDVSLEPRFVQMTATGSRSELAVPIRTQDRVIGVLNAQSNDLDAFDESDLAVLQSLANQAAVAIENARLFDAEQRRAEQFRVISKVGRHITSILDIDQMLVQVVQSIQQAFSYEHVGIAMIEGDFVEYKVGAGQLWDTPGFQFLPARLRVGEQGITGTVAATGEPILVLDVSKEPRYVWMEGSQTRSELALPIKAKGRVVGVLDVQSNRVGAFDESDLTVLQALAHQAAIVIENARLYEQAQRLAVLEERSRLARELHDAVTQTLFSASLIAETLPALWESDQEEGRQLLKELQQLNRGAMAEMRTLLLELRPASLSEASLDGLLRQLGEAVTGRTGIPVDVLVDGECVLPSDVHVTLYRIAQEALNNVVKHARASHVTVNLNCTPSVDGERVELTVIDDGVGFVSGDVEPGELGLGIMHERAMSIGAAFDVDSQLGRGTRVGVEWAE